MTESKKTKSPAMLLKDLMYLREHGFNIPDDLVTYTQWQDWKQRNVQQVWECACGTYESEIRIKAMTCPKHHVMKLKWKAD